MNRMGTYVTRVAAAGVLAIGTGMMTGVVSAKPVDLPGGEPGASGAMLITWVDHKGKPPYKRHDAGKREMEKGQFARLEETRSEATQDRKPIYRGVQGKHPPFNRTR